MKILKKWKPDSHSDKELLKLQGKLLYEEAGEIDRLLKKLKDIKKHMDKIAKILEDV